MVKPARKWPQGKRRKPRTSFQLISGDCLVELEKLSSESVDLVITSPPYGKQRSRNYGGIDPDKYVMWFLPIAKQIFRVLKREGSFILNIKECAVKGERHPYVMELILALRSEGWLFTEEYIWHKRNSHPGKWPNRFRDAWERCLHFTRQRKFKMYQAAVMVSIGSWADKRMKNLSFVDLDRDDSKVGSGFGKNLANWVGRDKVYPDNVLHLATVCNNRSHSATFPPALPLWFIKLFTRKGNIVLDPFSGIGTTVQAAVLAGRYGIGIEIVDEYNKEAEQSILKALAKKPKLQFPNAKKIRARLRKGARPKIGTLRKEK